jgi:hypothetical protein
MNLLRKILGKKTTIFPIWSDAQLSASGDPVCETQVTVHVRPPFYNGPIPLIYTSRQVAVGRKLVTVYCDLGAFRSTFVHTDLSMVSSGIPVGARTTGASDRVLAEARLVGYDGGPQIEEFHYGPDYGVEFQCKSTFDHGGYKIRETDARGKKINEYYFTWPSG